jgi:predicted short-subunit dehydrogenase-like oxidoreductase (DUF2520 family)
MAAKPKSITLVGAGNLAFALGPALKAAGYRVDAVVGRSRPDSQRRARMLAKKLGARSYRLDQVKPASDVIWLLHTDDALAGTAKALAKSSGWKGRVVLHSSGALSSDVLAPLKRAGAYTASLHPMMTFVPGAAPDISQVRFAVEGDLKAANAAKQIARKLGAEVFPIKKSKKVLYHALGSFSSPLVVATLVTAERVGRAAGLSLSQTRKVMAGILQQTLKNYLERGLAAAFSGPIKRGDLETVRSHLRELQRVPEARDVYRALVRSALQDLPSARRGELLQMLSENPTADERGSTRIRKNQKTKLIEKED